MVRINDSISISQGNITVRKAFTPEEHYYCIEQKKKKVEQRCMAKEDCVVKFTATKCSDGLWHSIKWLQKELVHVMEIITPINVI